MATAGPPFEELARCGEYEIIGPVPAVEELEAERAAWAKERFTYASEMAEWAKQKFVLQDELATLMAQASRDRRQLELVTEERDEAVKTVNALQERLQRVDLWKSAGDPSSPLHDSSDPDPPLSARGQRELEKRKKLELLLQHQQEKLQEQARQLGEQTRLIQRQTEYLNELKDRLNDATQKSDVVRSQSFSDREYFVRELDLLQAQLSEVGEEVHRRAELERSLREELSKCKEKLVDAEKEQEDAQASRMRQIGTQIGADATQLSHDIKKTDERRQDIRDAATSPAGSPIDAIKSHEISSSAQKELQQRTCAALEEEVAALKEKLLLSEEQMEKLAAAGYKKSYDSPRFKPLNSPKLDPIKEGQTEATKATNGKVNTSHSGEETRTHKPQPSQPSKSLGPTALPPVSAPVPGASSSPKNQNGFKGETSLERSTASHGASSLQKSSPAQAAARAFWTRGHETLTPQKGSPEMPSPSSTSGRGPLGSFKSSNEEFFPLAERNSLLDGVFNNFVGKKSPTDNKPGSPDKKAHEERGNANSNKTQALQKLCKHALGFHVIFPGSGVSSSQGGCQVYGVVKGSPADMCGQIFKGDVIEQVGAVNGNTCLWENVQMGPELLTNQIEQLSHRGTSLALRLRRKGSETEVAILEFSRMSASEVVNYFAF